MIFFGSHERESSLVELYSIPLEGCGNSRHGAPEGPLSIRESSHLLETYVPRYQKDFLDLEVGDKGDVKAQSLSELPDALEGLSFDKPYIFLGGDHSISYFTAKACAQRYPELCVITLDAHLDAYVEYGGEAIAHATWTRRLGEDLGNQRIWHLGGRAYTKEEESWFRYQQRLMPLHEVSLEEASLHAVREIGARPVYLSLDIDVLDPAYAPGVSNPESLGAQIRELYASLHSFAALNIVAFDVVEIIPKLDPHARTAAVAAELTRDMTLMFWGK